MSGLSGGSGSGLSQTNDSIGTAGSGQILVNNGGIVGGVPVGANTNGLSLYQNNGNYSFAMKNYWNIAGINDFYSQFSSGAPSTDWQSSSRTQQTTIGPISRMALIVYNGAGQVGTTFEQPGLGKLIMRASLEYPSTQTPYQFSVNGSTTWVMDPAAPFTITDPIGVSIPANTNYWIRYYNRTPFPPTALAAAVTVLNLGQLAASTQYFYKITSIDTGLESGPTAEVNATTGLTTLSVNLTWTANPNASAYNIYRSTTTGAETLIATVPAPSTGYTDSNFQPIVSAQTPPAQYSYYFNQLLGSSKLQSNVQQSSGTGADLTTSTGGTWITGPSNTQMAQQYAILTDDFANNSVCFIGDSIAAGTGIITNAAQGFSSTLQNWPTLGVGTSKPMLNESIAGSKQTDLTNGTTTIVARRRLGMAEYCNIIISPMGRNDLFASAETWQQLASSQLQLALAFSNQGKRYYITTITPNTASTDSWITASNQSPLVDAPHETKRVNYNTWVRNGSQVDGGGSPVLSGGTASTIIKGFFDVANVVEVNSSNVITLNGGNWLAPAAPAYTAQVLTGSPSATSLPVSTASYPVNGLTTYAIKMTSGTQNGNFGIVLSNTATGVTLGVNGVGNFTGVGAYVGLSGAPSAGDTFNIYQISTPQDGVHGTTAAYALISTAFSTWLAALPAF